MAEITTPTKARANLDALIKIANRDSTPVIIAGSDVTKSAVLMSKRDYEAMQETMALLLNGQLQDAVIREGDDEEKLDAAMNEPDKE
ncbi:MULTISPECIES: type II toxin-antitoxin system Phd/YefM family antitoxin [unclassified Lacticaseibacillus]|uniref:type II toxin-antitoxin system Phd/YefM family antitoxin n=1 Tax=unclassified Lacticaseibacillus TaxID=2759744 RepID=UPI001940BFFB|nr:MULTISPECIES: type II toxin-antitoxin system Phd/YefM family antitoxin [unclassified Lacticaseibacillus]